MLTIADVLEAEDVARVRERLSAMAFVDGRTTAGATARKVKANTQADPADEGTAALATFVRQALERCEVLAAYARPVRWSRLLFSRYGPGDAYGLHVDDAAMKADDGGRMRTDLSFTLFLSDPERYEGGALLLEGLDGEREVKLAAGSLVLYPTGVLHQVTPVTAGERLACVGWLQSAIRRADQRELLFDLSRVRAVLPGGDARLLLDKSMGGLLRQWAEP
jgi:PKHD-type hydroxylase